MANVYVDLDLGSGLNNGTSWANAYQTPSALGGASLSGGDDVWVQGNTNAHSGSILTFSMGGTAQNPIKIRGVAQGTTAEPPTSSDLIPGWATGEARTLANRAYKDADVPVFRVSDTAAIRFVMGGARWYGVKFETTGGDMHFRSTVNQICDECLFELSAGGELEWENHSGHSTLNNCGYETNNAANVIKNKGQFANVIGLELIATTVPTGGLFTEISGYTNLVGSDLTGLGANELVGLSALTKGYLAFNNCAIDASTPLTSGSSGAFRRIELGHTSSDTGKSSGTILNLEIATNAGSIVEETTAVRTGGANDGSSNWSLAFTPTANATRDNVVGLVGPWTAFKITGDGTAQTVSVSIANSGAADYNDDDVWLEVMYPSEGGTAQYDNQTSQMDLLGTPTAVTDDTGSTWGAGANNHQTLSVSISPDYVGRAYCRVVFAKNFSSSPETLYVDPLPVVS